MELILADQIYIARENVLPALRLAAFQNPDFYRAQSMRLPTYDKPRIIHCAKEHPSISLCRAGALIMCGAFFKT